MPTRSALTPPAQVLPDSPPPKKTLSRPSTQPGHTSFPIHELQLSSPSVPHTPTSSIRLQPTTDFDCETTSAIPQSGEPEDEYTLSAYGDISLSEIIVPPLPPSTHPSQFQSRFPQPRLRLKVQRPPMPKRRLSHTYIPDPMPYTGRMDRDEYWPGSPRPFENKSPWFRHQPLISPLSPEPMTPWMQGNKPAKNGGSSIEKLFDELIPRSPSIRLSPPSSPAHQSPTPLRETREPKSAVQQPRNAPKAVAAVMPPQPSPAQSQEKPWRTRFPPRPPIPKWEV